MKEKCIVLRNVHSLFLFLQRDLAVGTDVGEQRNRALMATTREIYVRERIASGALLAELLG